MMRKRPLGWPDLHGLTAGTDELTQEHEEHEEHEEERSGILEHKQDTRTVSLTGRSNRSNRIHKRVGDWQEEQEGILDGCFSNGQPSRSNKVTRR